jgi:ABC-type nitrate/sulfonate/bicarbonate transport system substrate-binding protein
MFGNRRALPHNPLIPASNPGGPAFPMTAAISKPIRIGGVPEHFNMPWHLAIEADATASSGLTCEWRDYSTGTGAMLADLAAGKLDLAILLTEGAALGLARGLPIEAVSLFTTSPLTWGVHVPADSKLQLLADLDGRRFAISRYGSGSHLMTLALAIEQGWPVDALQFEIVDNLPGAVEAFRQHRADIFLWEHYTTEPAVAAGHIRRNGDIVSPWPAWVVCVNASVWQHHQQRIEKLLTIIAAAATELKIATDAAARIARRFELAESAVADWLTGVEWVDGIRSPEDALGRAHEMLAAAGALPRDL